MADLAALGGLGNGLLAFSDSYQKAKQQTISNARDQQAADLASQKEQAGLLQQGMQVNSDNTVGYNPVRQQQMERQNQVDTDYYDPESDISKSKAQSYQDRLETLKTGSGKYVQPGKSAAEYDKTFDYVPELESHAATVKAAQLKADASMYGSDTRADAAAKNGKNDPEKLYTEMLNKDNTFRGNKPASDAASALRSVGNAQELLKQYPDLNKMPQAQVNLLNDELAKIAGGGVATEGGRKELNSASFESGLQSLLGKTENRPTGAQLGEFLKQNVNYLGGLKSANQKIVNDFHMNNYKAYENRLGPEQQARYKAYRPELFADQSSDTPKGLLTPPPTVDHPQDGAALAWAKKNSDNPKAKEILQLNGIGQ